VIKEHFEPVSKREEKVKIISMENREVVSFQFKKRGEATRTFKLKTNDPLSIISNGFEGITITAVTASTVKFSNGIEKTVGEEMDVEIYMTSYQEQMIRLALQRHFEAEKENFCGRSFKIKSLALFFIDDITSYRSDKEEKSPYLLLTFERLLKEQIKAVIATLDEYNAEYREYLQTSLNNIAACHAGYFSNDNSDSDEDIAREVDAILHGKKRLLSFKNADDSYNTLRFLFSKWTLKEGWDNPNIFTIAKLRSSGSENSKLQEVGRGLRLPVDENGNRISNEEFYLNYIVDFTEADFAQRLVEQINGELPLSSVISEKKLEQVAKKLGFSSDDLFDALYSEHYIDRHLNIKTETRDAFFTKYPDFATGLTSGKVKDLNKTKAKPVKIRPAVYSEIKELWQILNQRYLLFYDTEVNVNEKVGSAVLSILEQGVFTDAVISSNRETIKDQGGQITAITGAGVQYTVMRPIAYNAFLTRISRATNIPIAALHNGMCEYTKKHGSIDSRYINENSAAAFIHGFQEWRNSELQTRFRYVKSGSPVGATALSYGDGSPRESIAQGRIGTKIIPGTPSAKYLYDVYAYDSPLEKNNIIADIEEVVVFGKIPRSSISIPTITGGMYSPDFMYVVRRKHDKPQLNIVVETKGVEDKDELRGVEKVKMGCARIFFDNLKAEGYDVVFREQLNNKAIRQIISEVMADDGIWNNVCRERI
jgi:type III restriction enzyme